MSEPAPSSASTLPVRGLHLDFKGVPPTIDRLLRLLAIASAAGYNAVLAEWEDMFPWTTDIRFREKYAYTPQDIARFHAEAAKLGIDVIPLVQCLGHMENPLSVADYKPLRQFAHISNVLDPLAPGARELIERMVDDVLALSPHPPRWFHLGGDEAWGFGTTDSAKKFIADHGGKGALYLHHVEPILDKLLARGIRPILWHDMMQTWEPEALNRIAKKADLMVWGYGESPETTRGHHRVEIIQRFMDHGVPLWGAGAYKGGEGGSNDLPNLKPRCENALGWAQVARRYHMQGVVATAWSRYSTHRNQCEPIDGALDVMIAVGLILRDSAWPPDIRDRAFAVLDQLGERARFQACYDALLDLKACRDGAWSGLRELREQLGLEEHDATRRASGIASENLYHAARWTTGAERAVPKVRAALDGLIPPESLDSYLRERLEPLQEQIRELTPRVAKLEPDTWPTTRAELLKQGIPMVA